MTEASLPPSAENDRAALLHGVFLAALMDPGTGARDAARRAGLDMHDAGVRTACFLAEAVRHKGLEVEEACQVLLTLSPAEPLIAAAGEGFTERIRPPAGKGRGGRDAR